MKYNLIERKHMDGFFYSSYNTHAIRKGNILRFFREKQALSPETAIDVSPLDWSEMGFLTPYNRIFTFTFEGFPYLKKTKEGKYWLDMERFEKSLHFSTAIIRFLIVAIIMLILIIILPRLLE